MATWLVFNTLADAESALAQINANIGSYNVSVNAATGQPEPSKQQTISWAQPNERVTDGKFAFIKPAAEHMTGVTNYTEEAYDNLWFTVTGDF